MKHDLDRKNIVHGTLVSDGSLSTTLNAIKRYIRGDETSFVRDEYEQLGRTSEAAKTICEKRMLY